MVYSRDIENQPTMKKGMPVLDKRGNPKGTGIVFENYTDGALQAVRDDGEGIIIINGISQQQAQMLLKFTQAVIPDPAIATTQQIEDVLSYAHTVLGIDDFFNGDRAKIPSFEVERLHSGNLECGIFVRRSDEERFALLGLGSGTYAGPASTPQQFHGTVAVVRNANHAWMVQTDAFLNTYRHPDDREINKADIPTVRMGLDRKSALNVVPQPST